MKAHLITISIILVLILMGVLFINFPFIIGSLLTTMLIVALYMAIYREVRFQLRLRNNKNDNYVG